MIGWLQGKIREFDPTGLLLLETHGIGYEVTVSLQTLCNVKVGEQASLYIHTHVREDQLMLFGFANAREREVFRKLNTVTGIGARMALNLMSGMPIQELLRAIDQADDTAIARTPGIGKKTAQRLILELKGKLVDSDAGMAPASGLHADLHSALVNLGYKPAQVDTALKQVDSSEFEQAFRQALKALA